MCGCFSIIKMYAPLLAMKIAIVKWQHESISSFGRLNRCRRHHHSRRHRIFRFLFIPPVELLSNSIFNHKKPKFAHIFCSPILGFKKPLSPCLMMKNTRKYPVYLHRRLNVIFIIFWFLYSFVNFSLNNSIFLCWDFDPIFCRRDFFLNLFQCFRSSVVFPFWKLTLFSVRKKKK